MKHMKLSRQTDRRPLRIEPLEKRLVLSTGPLITEFMASNNNTLVDSDGDSSDWIEIYNPTANPLLLNEWSLTDDAADPSKWQFPDITLQPDEYLVVFASNKDRAIAGQELHTNFKLSAGGEYLGLIEPDGLTIAWQFDPYSPQESDISFGLDEPAQATVLVDSHANANYLVPSNGNVDGTWMNPGFDDTGWNTGSTALGFASSSATLALYLPFDETTGTMATDWSGNSNNGQVNGTQWVNDPIRGPVIEYDSSSDYVMANLTPLTSTFTISFWALHSSVGSTNDGLFQVQNGGTIPSNTKVVGGWVHDTGRPWGRLIDLDGNSHNLPQTANPITQDTWTHYAYRGDGANYQVFIDGVPGPSIPYDGTILLNDRVFIGKQGSESWRGRIDDFAVWTESLAETEITALADGVKSPAQASGFGGIIQTDLSTQMTDPDFVSAYVRIPFNAASNDFDQLTLDIKYDDGFVAYLNGTEVARRNAPTLLAYDASAIAEQPNPSVIAGESINLSASIALLNPGDNVLTIHGMNISPNDDDFLIDAQLTAKTIAPGEYRYMPTPTPGQPNGPGYVGLVGDTTFDVDRGFYDVSFPVTINSPTPDAVIRYTTDGSKASETHGTIYDGPITISTTTTLRAMAYRQDWLSTNVDTQTYVFVDDVAQQPSDLTDWPDNWGTISQGTVPADYEMDPRVVNNTLPGYSVPDALLDIPTMSIAMPLDDFIGLSGGIYTHPFSRGDAWEKEISLELIYPDGTPGFQHDAQIEMHGNSSRNPYRMQKHSFRVTFKEEYGASKLNFPLFEDAPVETFNKLVLRAMFTDSWALASWARTRYRPNDSQYIRDVWMKQTFADMGQPSSYGNFVHLYINGVYWGLYNPTERLEDDFFSEHLGGEKNDWEINVDFRSPGPRWNAMMAIDPSSAAGYTQVQEYLDLENFADYMLLHFYADAEDWPGHNGYAAANAVSGDGKFRFFVWDQEIVLDKFSWNRYDTTKVPGNLFQKLIANDEFKQLFADRAQLHMFNGGALSLEANQVRYARIAGIVDKAIVAESARWGDVQMSTPYGNTINQPSSPDALDDDAYPTAPNGPDYYFTREDSWVVERDNILNHYLPVLHDPNDSRGVINEMLARDLFPTTDAPVLAQHGGLVSPGYELAASSPDGGVIYYTTDGSDPRLPGGQANTSAIAVDANVQNDILVSAGSLWKYLDDGSDQGVAWAEPSFNDTLWASGNAQLGYGENDEATVVSYGSSASNKHITTYFRKIFTVNDPSAYQSITLRVLRDDGAAVYLNGNEVYRTNLPGTVGDGTLTSHTLASESVGGSNENLFFTYTLDADDLAAGENIIAVEVHQSSNTSSDLSFDLELAASGESSVDLMVIDQLTTIKARSLNGGQWSALTDATFSIFSPADTNNLRVVEINYNPTGATAEELAAGFDDGDMFEFIELLNTTATETLDFTGVNFTSGIAFSFGAGISLPPGERIVVVSNQSAFEARYGTGINVAGEYTGKLSNSGEDVQLDDATGSIIQSFGYNDAKDWPGRADGDGSSLVVIDTDGDYNAASNWRASTAFSGTPGGAAIETVDVLINEVLAHSNSPTVDAIELFNSSSARVDLSNWWLSDSSSNFFKYQFAPGESLASGAYLVLDENDFNPGNGADPNGFALSSAGDDIWLLAADVSGKPIRFADVVSFDATLNGITLGRIPSGSNTYELFPLSNESLGTQNGAPLSGPIIVSEVHYHPLPPLPGSTITEQQLEFVELYNRSDQTIVLNDGVLGGWQLRGGVDFNFNTLPIGAALAAGEVLVVVPFDPSNATLVNDFKLNHGINASGTLVGPFNGQLDNGGETVRLLGPTDRPMDNPEPVHYLVDRVRYDDVDPWPTEPDGTGYSLTRILAGSFGDAAASWQANTPTPGSEAFVPAFPGDFDTDGDVDQDDLDIWEGGFATLTGAGWSDGDSDEDGDVDGDDFLSWQQNYLGSVASAPAAAIVNDQSLRSWWDSPRSSQPGPVRARATDLVMEEFSADETMSMRYENESSVVAGTRSIRRMGPHQEDVGEERWRRRMRDLDLADYLASDL